MCITEWIARKTGTRPLAVFAIAALLLVAPLAADDWDDWNYDAAATSNDDWNGDDWNGDDWGAWDAGDDELSISGYFESTGIALLPRELDGEPHFGLQSILRLRGRFDPADSLSVTVEAEYRDRRGAANPLTRQSLMGAPSLDESAQGQFPSTDFNREFVFDYAYASARFGPVDLRVGRQPLTWGTAYAFNPTELMNPASLAELTGVEPPGLTAIAPSISLGSGFGLEGYVAFEDRSRQATALSGLAEAGNLPAGARARAYVGTWDLAAGVVRSVEAAPAAAGSDIAPAVDDYAVAELAGPIGPVTFYGEAAVEIDPDDQWEAERSIDGAVGFQYELPFEIGLQAEYHRRGRGETGPANYDPQARIAGRLAARDYLVGIVDFHLFDDRVHSVFAALTNLNDGSVAFMPEVQYSPYSDLEISLGGSVLFGPDESEFDGRFDLPTGPGPDDVAEVDIARSQLYLSAKWYF